MPFDDKKPKKMIFNQLKHRIYFPEKHQPSIEAQKLIRHMLHPKRQNRATINDIINNEWLKNCR